MPEKDLSGRVQQFQQFQQQYQSIVFQKETISLQMQEIDSAIKELASAKGDAFKAVGMVLIKKDAPALKAELQEQKETFEARLKSIEKQEKLLADKLAELQKSLIQSQMTGQKTPGGAE